MTYLRRYNANRDLTPADREAIVTLVRELGHDPDNIAETFAVTCDSTGVRLHLTEHLRDESGAKRLDVAADQIASRPHVHDIDPSRLPEAIRPPAEVGRYRPDVVASWVDRVRVRADGIEGRVVACHDGPAVLVQADDGTSRWYPAETAARAGLHCVDCDHDLGMHGMLGCWQPVDGGVCECRQWVERR